MSPTSSRKSNSQAGAEAVLRVQQLLAICEATGGTLPVKNGALWHAEIKRRAKLSNSQIDGNAEIKALLMEHATTHGLAFSRRGKVAPEEDSEPVSSDANMVPIERLRDAQMRLAAAERKNAELRAENASLKAQALRGDEVAELIAAGGRVLPGQL